MSVVTIRDVAQAAGVSLSSVSRALNGGKHVSARIARDVTAAADRLGYQPDFMARSLRTRSTGMVGCLVSDVANPLNASIVQAAEARLREAGYLLVVAARRTTRRASGPPRSSSGEDGWTACWWRPAAMPTRRPGASSPRPARPSSSSIAIPRKKTATVGPPSWSIIAPARRRRPGI